MGIFGALTTAVGGLRANSYALENISGNIANSQTTAFKRIDTSFLDLIPDTGLTRSSPAASPPSRAAPTRCRVECRRQQVAPTWPSTATGFFSVQKPGTFTDDDAVVRRRRSLHPPRRFPARQERLPRQWRRLLSAGRADRSDHGQSDRQRAAGSEIPERLPAVAGDHQDRLPRQPRQLPADHQPRYLGAGIGTAAACRLPFKSESPWDPFDAVFQYCRDG